MATRDKYTRPIKCPKCDLNGILYVSENDYPFMNKLDRCIYKIDGNFSVSVNPENDVIDVKCLQCEAEFIG